jgi:xanthine dehydrogenase small subunit
MTTTQPIRFFHRGQIVDVDGVHPTRSVLDWLRVDAHCPGTKEGCNEGDCGACTVVIGSLPEGGHARSGSGLQLQTVNACIQFLPTLHGKALFTVEDLKEQAAAACAHKAAKAPHDDKAPVIPLHPVQQAMVDCHGSQCGFCTPGFVMSLWSTYEHHQAGGTRPTRQQLADDLSGNLCRCTGYRPILDAGQRMFDLPALKLDPAPVVQALQSLERGTDQFHYSAKAPTKEPRTDHYYAPRTLADLAALREQIPKAQLLSGSTDIGLWVNKQFRDLGDIVYVGDVAELKTVTERAGPNGPELYIGAGASLEAAWRALASRFSGLVDVWLRFASLPIRNAGTMGGNVANGSPIGDSPPVLMSLDADIELLRGSTVRRMPLTEFYIDYMKNHLQPGELVQGVAVPLAVASRQVRAYKISKRFDCDISALCAGFSLALDGNTVREIRLAYGGMAGIVKRAAKAEAALAGKPWTQANVDAAKQALTEDFKPLTDMRASAAYRMQVAQNLLQRLWLETRTVDALPTSATSVFNVMPHAAA